MRARVVIIAVGSDEMRRQTLGAPHNDIEHKVANLKTT